MGKKTGALIRQARTAAKLTQAQLAEAVSLSAADIGKAERGELELTQAALKTVAKTLGITQTSLLNAEKGTAKPPKASPVPMKLNDAEQKLVKLYRKANADRRSDALRILNGEQTEVEQLVEALLGKKWKEKARK